MLSSGRLVWLLVLCGLGGVQGFRTLRVGAFNVQVFGRTKASKPEVMSVLAQIIQRYDIILIQEIRDYTQTAICQLQELTNILGPAMYQISMSQRLGRTRNKEQYAFIYRNNSGIAVLDTYHYPDINDEFEREPYAVYFHAEGFSTQDFVLASIHVDPDTAVQELDSLVDVHSALVSRWSTDNVVIMGDFNADCKYVSASRLGNLALRGGNFTWFIGDGDDTTVKSTDCAYDRFVVTGAQLVTSVVGDRASVYRFDVDHGLTQDEAEAVSDHYPIELELGPSACLG